jgi:hypothetical protein
LPRISVPQTIEAFSGGVAGDVVAEEERAVVAEEERAVDPEAEVPASAAAQPASRRGAAIRAAVRSRTVMTGAPFG